MSDQSVEGGRTERKRWLAIAVAFSISAASLIALFASVDLDQTVSAIARAEHSWLIGAAAVQVAILLLRALRWRFLFREAVRFGDLFWSQAVGYLASNVLPLRVGDLVRFGWLFARKRAPAAEIAFTIIFERFLDVLTLFALGALALAAVGSQLFPGVSLITPAMIALGGGLAGVVVMSTLPRWPLYNRLAPAMQRWVVEIAHCVISMMSWRGVMLSLLTLLCAAASVAYAWLVIRSLAPDASLLDATIATAAVMVAMAIPAAPGSIGTFHLAASVALTTMSGYPAETAIVISVLLHAIQYLGGSAIGLAGVGMWPGPALREAVSLARSQYAARSSG